MKIWQQAPAAWVCGRCANIFDKGTPQLLIALPMVKQPRMRCATCAGEPVPANLPAAAPIAPASTAVTASLPFASVGALAADWKTKQAGE